MFFPKPKYHYAEDILNRKFKIVAELIRLGDISELDVEARNLLADYLEGKLKKSRGRPKDNNEFDIAEYCFNEFSRLRREGLKREDALREVGNSCSVVIGTNRVEQHLANYRPYAEQQWHESYLCDLSINYGHQILTEYRNKCKEGSTHEEAISFIADNYQVEYSEAEKLVNCASSDSSNYQPSKA